MAPQKRSKSPARSKSPRTTRRSKSPAVPQGKVKFFDLIQKKPFYTSEFEVVVRKTNSKNGKRKVTYLVTDNPTARNDGKHFKNWKILSNEKA